MFSLVLVQGFTVYLTILTKMTFADQKKNQVLAGGIVEEKGIEGKRVEPFFSWHLSALLIPLG